MSDKTQNILIVGVGGQGVLLASELLSEVAIMSGFDVKKSEVHGMSQRGGSVEASVLIGPGRSSFIPNGGADLVLGLEPLETLRARPSMSESTLAIVNLGRVVPTTMTLGGVSYPEIASILEAVRAVTPKLVTVDGPSLVAEATVTSASVATGATMPTGGGIPATLHDGPRVHWSWAAPV